MQRCRALQRLGAALRAQGEASSALARERRRLSSTPAGGGPGGAPSAVPEVKAAATAAEEAAADAEMRARALAEAKLKFEGAGLFPWERYAFGDRTQELTWWQKAYWVGFAVVMTYWAGEKAYNKATTGKWHGNEVLPASAAKARPKPTLIKSRINDALSGASFVAVDEEEDPFDGLTPAEIESLVAKEAKNGDAFEGMSPQEINEYLERERLEREGQLLAEGQPAAAVGAPAVAQ